MKPSSLFLVAGLSLLSVSPAIAGGFNGRDLANAAQKSVKSQPGQDAVEARNATEVLRLQLTYNPQATIQALPDDLRQKVISAFGETGAKRQYQIGWLMSGAIAKPGKAAYQTRLYNPLAQVWIDLSWAKDGEGLKLSAIETSIAKVDDWSSQTGPYLMALGHAYAAAVNNGLSDASVGDALFTVSDKWIQGLADWVLSPAKSGAVKSLQGLISAGECQKYGVDGTVIDSLPAAVRASFAPITGFHTKSGGAVLLSSPLYPQIIVAADFDNAAKPKLKNITLLNLGNIEGAK